MLETLPPILDESTELYYLCQDVLAIDEKNDPLSLSQKTYSLYELIAKLHPQIPTLLTPHEEAQIRERCGLAEAFNGKRRVKKILQEADPLTTIKGYEKYNKYVRFASLERLMIEGASNKLINQQPNLFIGCGALPVTSIILASEFGIPTINIDQDPEALNLAEDLIKSCQLSHLIKFQQAKGEHLVIPSICPTILVAALAGSDEEAKAQIFQNISKNTPPDTLVMTRMGEGNRRLVYFPFNERVFGDLKLIYKLTPQECILNTMILLRNAK